MASKVINTILNLKDNFSNTISKAASNTKQFQREMKVAENQARKMREGIAGTFTSTGAKIAGLVGAVGITEFAKSSLELASNLTEVQNVVDTTFGSMNTKINEFASNAAASYGISELSAKKYSGTLGAMLKSAGYTGDELADMSTSLTGLAGDLASFYNLNTDEAFDKLKSGISGETEPLKALGIDISDTTVSTYAMANGFTGVWSKATQAEKELWRYKEIMNQTSDAQGDYAKTSDTFANALRTLKLNIQTFGASIMNYAIPSFEELFKNVNGFIKNINVKDIMENKVIPAITEMGKIIDTLKNNMKTIIPIVSGVVGGLVGFMVIGKVTSEVKNFLKVINGIAKLTNPFYIIAAGIGLLITGLVNAYNTSDDFRERVNNLFDKIMGFGDYAGNTLPGLLDSLTNVFTNDLQPALDKIRDVSVEIFDFVSDNWNTLAPIVTGIVGALGAYKLALIAIAFNTKVVSIVTAAWNTIELIIWGIVNATSVWEAVQWTLNVAMNANPIGVVTGLIAALGLAIYELVIHWQDICSWVQTLWDKFLNSPVGQFIQSALNPLIDAVKGVAQWFGDLIDKIKNAWNWFTSWVDKWNNTTLTDKTVNITGVTSGVDAIKPDTTTFNPYGYATGTQFSPGGWTITGEHGPELQYMQKGTKVLTNNQTQRVLNGQNSGVNVQVIVQGNMIGNEEFADKIGQHIFNQIQLGMINS